MSDCRQHLASFRCFTAVAMACLALLAGCVPQTNRVAPVPTNVAAAGGVSTITISWNSSLGASAYKVKRATDAGGPYTQITSTAGLSYDDSAVAVGTLYHYVVSSVAQDGESADSVVVSAALAVPPAAPTNPGATPGDGQVTLNWSASTSATGYRVKRSTVSGGPYTLVGTATTTTYVDTTVTNFTTYYYVISATNVAGESANSVQVRARPILFNPPTAFGTWIDVTPRGIDLTSPLCSNYGATTIQADPANPSHLYTMFHCQGIWKSTNYGASWTGPINTGTNAALIGDCSGGITIPPNSTASVPTIYAACIRGSGIGFWKSSDGGVNWTRYTVAVTTRQDFNPPLVNPYDQNHLLMAGHEFDSAVETIVQSVDGGANWTRVPLAPAMLQNGRSPLIFFINTGNATSTRATWLWLGDASGGSYGTWRTADSGTAWARVDSNEHIIDSYIYQPDTSGVIYMAGANSELGSGILRSSDYGLTWVHVGQDTIQTTVIGTSKYVYGMYGLPADPGGSTNPSFQVAFQPGEGTWVAPGTPAALTQGAAQLAVVNNGANNILVGAMWKKGVWRYVEP